MRAGRDAHRIEIRNTPARPRGRHARCAACAGTAQGAQLPPPSPPDFDAAVKAAAELPRLHSLLVSHRGTSGARALLQRHDAPTRLANVKSVSKSIISALVGIAIERRNIPNVREPIGTYFVELFAQPADAPKRRITIEQLLTMQAGLESTSSRNYGAWVTSRELGAFALSRELQDTPGTAWSTAPGNTHLLSAILTEGDRARVPGSTRKKSLAKPLGFSLAQWPQDPQGIYFGGNEMLMTPRQMVAFGELYLYRGRAGGAQIVPEHWIDDSFVPRGRSDYGDQVYGYGWWMRELAGQQAYLRVGFRRAIHLRHPVAALVVVTTSSTATGEERRSHRRTIFDLLHSVIWSAGAWDLGPGV